VKKGSELSRRIESLCGEILPSFFFKDPAINLIVPEHIKGLPLRVIIGASQANEG
jgi:hypothetical protein